MTQEKWLCPACNGHDEQRLSAHFLDAHVDNHRCVSPDCDNHSHFTIEHMPCGHPSDSFRLEYCVLHSTLSFACRQCSQPGPSFLVANQYPPPSVIRWKKPDPKTKLQ
jgi:hypothetical protein